MTVRPNKGMKQTSVEHIGRSQLSSCWTPDRDMELELDARRVLADCRVAFRHLELDLDPVDFRVHWAAVVALLRAVGHVLKKVDAARHSGVARAVDRRWQFWNQNRDDNKIFWDFIESERNNILKAYSFGYGEDDVEIESVNSDGTRVIYANVPFVSALQSGPFAGPPGKDVLRQALAWWEEQLNVIDEEVAQEGA